MLGLADRGRIFDLLEQLLGGATGEALGCSPACTATAPSPARSWPTSPRPCTSTTRAKTLGATAAGEGLSAEERRRAAALAERLSVAILARAWQMLLKGLEEVARAPNPAAAAEMVLIRLAYTADLPAPDEIITALAAAARQRAGARAPASARPAAAAGSRDASLDAPDAGSGDESGLGAMTTDEASTSPDRCRRRRCRSLRSFADVVALAGDAPRGQAQGAPGRAREPGALRPRRQHRAASAGRRAQGARQRAAREAQRLDRQALDGGAEQDAGRARRSAR